MAANKTLHSSLVCILLCFVFKLSAQNNIPLLERKVNIQSSNRLPEEILRQVEQQCNFTFSYSPQVIEGNKPVTIQNNNSTVREVLDKIFSGEVTYKEKGNHIILIKKPSSAIAQESSGFIISGYVKDASNGNEISEASVFDKQSKISAITDQYGYFKMHVNSKQKEDVLFLSVNKINYQDTVVYVSKKGNSIVNVEIYPETIPASVDSSAIRDSLLNADQMAFLNLILSNEIKTNTKNINDTLYNDFQFSFLPFLGTNLKLSGVTVNDYSLNILAGYSLGTRKLEVGGLFNIDRDSVKCVQVAGLSNIVGGPVSGVQAAGLFNVNRKSVKGVQLAGLINNNIDTSHAVELAGLMNVNVKNSTAPQIAGLLNVGVGNVKGLQLSGLLNVGVKEVNGVQISGLVNYATILHGSQVGFLNISDSCSGVPIGFMSIVRNGYHQLEISADETYPLNASFRTGVRSFYNIFTAGLKELEPDSNVWSFGYGLGSAIKLGRTWDLNLELTMNQPIRNNELNNFNPLTKFNLTFEKRFSKYFAIAGGPSFNFFYADTTDPEYSDFLSKIPPSKVIDTSKHNEYLATSWIGGRFALRFF